MDELLLSYIQQIINSKAENGIVPTHATYVELKKKVFDSMSESLNRMYLEKKIKAGDTINDRWIIIK